MFFLVFFYISLLHSARLLCFVLLGGEEKLDWSPNSEITTRLEDAD